MSHRKLILAGLAWAAVLLTLQASAQEPSTQRSVTETNRPGFKALLRSGETVGTHQVERTFLTIGTNQIAFIVPTGFRVDATDPQKIVLTEPAKGYFITVRVGNVAEAGSEMSNVKAEALNRYPEAKITRESIDIVANHSGPAFNLEWLDSNGTSESAHINFIPSAAGILEFTVKARSVDFKDARIYFESLLASFQNNESGKLVIVPLPDFS